MKPLLNSVFAALLLIAFAALPSSVSAASLALDVSSAAPRQVEDTTASSIERDYAHAWSALSSALQANRAELLDENFTGAARDHWQHAIDSQRQNGLSRRIVDRGHHLRVLFYSLDGSALEAEDLADLEIEYRDGEKVLSSEHVTLRYLVLLTPAENSWKIRILEELPPA
jgi:aminopeptidase N